MGVAEALSQVFQDAYFAIVNILDATKRVIFDLSGMVTGKTVTLRSAATDNRTITFPDKSGTVELLEQVRTPLCDCDMDFDVSEIRTLVMTSSFTLNIINPIQGKVVLIEATANGFVLSFPPSVKILSGKFDKTTTNYIYFHCTDGATPVYLVTIGQQIA